MAGRSKIAFESRFDRTPAEIWRVVSDSNRGNEVTEGLEPYTAEDVLQADGSVIRYARGRMGPFRVEWEEGFGEWVENRYIRQVRRYKTGPLRSLGVEFRLLEDGGGTRVVSEFTATWDSWLGTLLYRLGVLDKVPREVIGTMEAAVAALDTPDTPPWPVSPPKLTNAQQERLARCVGEIEAGPFGHGLAQRLGDYLAAGPVVELKRIRPLALARDWEVPAEAAIELCVASQCAGLLDMRWTILCPRCRGAKSQPANLYELPKGVHCESCNIDFEREFSRNVELVFSPAAWLRELPEGEFCMLGAASTPHVKVQREVEPGGVISERLELRPGSYRLRTVEAGGQCEVGHDGTAFPEVIARGDTVEAGPPAAPGQVTLRNMSDRTLNLVIDRRFPMVDVQDAIRYMESNQQCGKIVINP